MSVNFSYSYIKIHWSVLYLEWISNHAWFYNIMFDHLENTIWLVM